MVDERTFTAGLAKFFAPPRGKGALGIGDDAAVVCHHGSHAVLACDPVVEGVHFAAATPLRRVAHKAVHRNLADLAAMGAVFDYALVSVLWPKGRPVRGLRALFAGLRAAVEGAGGRVVGGDLGATAGPLVVTVTVSGHPVGTVLRRDAARVGDRIFVSAPLGGSIAGHHLRFVAPLALGAWLARQRGVGAVIDVSDGLALDLRRVLAASQARSRRPLGAVLAAAAIPVSAAARRLAGHDRGRDREAGLARALGDGEDHALLFTLRRGVQLPASPVLAACGRTPIGEVVAARGVRLRDADGSVRALGAVGYQHRLGR